MIRLTTTCMSLLVLAACAVADPSTAAAKNFGKTPTLTDPVAISTLNTAPAEHLNKSVLLTGTIVDMCRHSGCWIEVEGPDSSRIICKSLDESILFTPDCLGKQVALQGKLMYDPKAPGVVRKAHEGEAAHACPAPKVMVSIEGASVNLAAVASPPAAQGAK